MVTCKWRLRKELQREIILECLLPFLVSDLLTAFSEILDCSINVMSS